MFEFMPNPVVAKIGFAARLLGSGAVMLPVMYAYNTPNSEESRKSSTFTHEEPHQTGAELPVSLHGLEEFQVAFSDNVLNIPIISLQ